MPFKLIQQENSNENQARFQDVKKDIKLKNDIIVMEEEKQSQFMELETQASFTEDPQYVNAYSEDIFNYLRRKEKNEDEMHNYDYLRNM